MTIAQQQFLELLRAGIWNFKPDFSKFNTSPDWQEIYRESKKQAMLAVILDAVNRLSPDLQPERSLYLKWCAEAINIEDDNEKINTEVVNLFKFLHKNNINPILMKGQSLSVYYPNPLFRTSGDIDIYIGAKNYLKVCNLLGIEGHTDEKITTQHISYKWHDIIVENHYSLSQRHSPIINHRLKKIIDENLYKGKEEVVEINGYKIETFSPTFNSMYLLLHIIQHLLHEGIGLRQLCDWALFIHFRHKDINWKELKVMLVKLEIIQGWKIFGAITVKYLGLPKEDIFIDFTSQDEQIAKVLIDDILHNGNFGNYGERLLNRPKGFFKRRLFNYKQGLKRIKLLKNITPSEVRWWPLMYVWEFILYRLNLIKPS